MMAVMGGMRSFWGPLLGAAVFVVISGLSVRITVNWMSFLGMLFVRLFCSFRADFSASSGERAQHDQAWKSETSPSASAA